MGKKGAKIKNKRIDGGIAKVILIVFLLYDNNKLIDY